MLGSIFERDKEREKERGGEGKEEFMNIIRDNHQV